MTVERDDLNGAEHDNKPTHKLEDVQVYKVDLVKRPATGDAFLAVRSADEGRGEPMTRRRAMSVEQFRRQYRKEDDGSVTIAQLGDPVAAEPESVNRQVPDADASTEDKREAQQKRSEKYGIEAWDGKGENLSYPSGDPTRESLYGDPVNLKYPVAYDDNEISLERANNARARFKQNADSYSEEKSKEIVHTRIVEAQIKAGANPGYDENDPLDKLLPQSTVDKLEQGVERNSDEDKGETEMSKAILERMDKMTEGFNGLNTTLQALVNRMAPEEPEPKPDTEAEGDAPEAAPDTEGKTEPEAEAAPKADTGDQPAPETDATPTEPAATAPEAEPAADDTPAADAATVERMTATLEGVAATMDAVTRGMTATGDAVAAMGERVTGLAEQVGTLTQRMNSVERGLTTSNAEPQDETEAETDSVERSAKPKGVFDGLLFGGRSH